MIAISLLVLSSAPLLLLITIVLCFGHYLTVAKALTRTNSSISLSPTELNAVDVLSILVAVVIKTFLSVFGLVPRLKPTEDGFSLPKITITAPLRLTDSDYKNYNHAVGKPEASRTDRNKEPTTPSLILAATTTPLMILTLANFSSPILPLGSVNTKNRFEFVAPEKCQNLREATATVTFGGSNHGRRTRRGIEFDMIIEVYTTATELVFRQVISVMQTLPKKTQPPYKGSSTIKQESKNFSLPFANIKFDSFAPFAWCNVCKDYNPIHVSSLLAKMFGLPGRVAHGNHVVAAMLTSISVPPGKWFLEVAYKRPMVLPIELDVTLLEDDKGRFAATKADKIYVEGTTGDL